MLQLGVETGEKRMKRGQMKGNETHVLYGFLVVAQIGVRVHPSVRAGLLGKTRELENYWRGERSGMVRTDKTWKDSHRSLDLAKKSERKCEVRTQHVTTRDQRHGLFNFSIST